MNQSTARLLEVIQSARDKVFPSSIKQLPCDFERQEASDYLKNLLIQEKPCMICRFGSGELNATLRYIDSTASDHFLSKLLQYCIGNTGPFWWDDDIKWKLKNSAGFFPPTTEFLERFAQQMLSDAQNIDVLGSWLRQETRLHYLFPLAKVIRLTDLEPYYHSSPWTQALKGQTVLVIHPFEESIKCQYLKRENLFQNPNVLPEFELKTLKAVQSGAGNHVEFSTWFHALDYMCEIISQTTFDVAIIGAGSYGFPIASFVKSLGKKSLHLGGATQILFGIKGKRWDDRPFFQNLYNGHWIRPLPHEVPNAAHTVEKGCYW